MKFHATVVRHPRELHEICLADFLLMVFYCTDQYGTVLKDRMVPVDGDKSKTEGSLHPSYILNGEAGRQAGTAATQYTPPDAFLRTAQYGSCTARVQYLCTVFNIATAPVHLIFNHHNSNPTHAMLH
jgi:hypothetical protein